MKRVFILSCIAAAGLSTAPAASAHQVTPPGLDGECTTTLHAGKAVPAHTIAMPVAAPRSPAVTGGFCTS
jgi:hypothetical protein